MIAHGWDVVQKNKICENQKEQYDDVSWRRLTPLLDEGPNEQGLESSINFVTPIVCALRKSRSIFVQSKDFCH